MFKFIKEVFKDYFDDIRWRKGQVVIEKSILEDQKYKDILECRNNGSHYNAYMNEGFCEKCGQPLVKKTIGFTFTKETGKKIRHVLFHCPYHVSGRIVRGHPC